MEGVGWTTKYYPPFVISPSSRSTSHFILDCSKLLHNYTTERAGTAGREFWCDEESVGPSLSSSRCWNGVQTFDTNHLKVGNKIYCQSQRGVWGDNKTKRKSKTKRGVGWHRKTSADVWWWLLGPFLLTVNIRSSWESHYTRTPLASPPLDPLVRPVVSSSCPGLYPRALSSSVELSL